jgi:hypothetical protein
MVRARSLPSLCPCFSLLLVFQSRCPPPHRFPLSPSLFLLSACESLSLSLPQSLAFTQTNTHKRCMSHSSHSTACLQDNECPGHQQGTSVKSDERAGHRPLCKHAVQLGINGMPIIIIGLVLINHQLV